MEINWKMVGGLILAAIIATCLITLMLSDFVKIAETRYEMPNGVICESSRITGGGFGGATNEFYRCEDGKRYINPETYRKLKVQVKFNFSKFAFSEQGDGGSK